METRLSLCYSGLKPYDANEMFLMLILFYMLTKNTDLWQILSSQKETAPPAMILPSQGDSATELEVGHHQRHLLLLVLRRPVLTRPPVFLPQRESRTQPSCRTWSPRRRCTSLPGWRTASWRWIRWLRRSEPRWGCRGCTFGACPPCEPTLGPARWT